jgi:hypothetical protein
MTAAPSRRAVTAGVSRMTRVDATGRYPVSRGTAYSRSLSYVSQPGTRPVSGMDVLSGYAMIHIIELMAAGAERQTASTEAWRLGVAMLRPGGIQVRVRPGTEYRSFRCLATNAARIRARLAMPWEEFVASPLRVGSKVDPLDLPRARLTADDIGQAQWLLECVRQVAEGGELLAAARRAHDGHLGKPRQQRQPVEAGWLSEQIDQTLTHAWWSLLQTTTARGQLWLQDPGGEDDRPTATDRR